MRKVVPNEWDDLFHTSFGNIQRLNDTYRFSSIPVLKRETVSQHTMWVALYSLLIHNRLGKFKKLTGYLLSQALVHDAVESESGDIVRTYKYRTKEFLRANKRAEEKVIDSFPSEIYNLFQNPGFLKKTEKDYIKSVVKAADFMSLVQFMRKELRLGNQEIIPYYKIMETDLANMSREAPMELRKFYTKLHAFSWNSRNRAK